MESLKHFVIRSAIRSKGWWMSWQTKRAAKNPERTQNRVLKKIIQKNGKTEFAYNHDFHEIKSTEDYRILVPVQDYESLRPYFVRQDRDGKPAILPKAPVMNAMTSGTTGVPKIIPISQETINAHRDLQKYFFYKLLQKRPDVFRGRILAIVSAAVEGISVYSKKSYGSTSGHMYHQLPKIMQDRYVVPADVFSIEDYDLKYLTILRVALLYDDITYVATANPSTLARLVKLLNENWESLLRDLDNGTFSRWNDLSPVVQRALAPVLKPVRRRARLLQQLDHRPIRFADLWPKLQAVGVWTGGSSQIFLQQLEGQFPEHTLIQDVGYLSSEFRGTVPGSPTTAAGVPTLLHHFFEFVAKDDWEEGKKKFLGLHELQEGQQYYLFVTTADGLYRYHMNDIVRVDGFYQSTPRLAFIQKGKGVTNITGEKLYEVQIITAVRNVEVSLGLQSVFYLAAANESRSVYTLYFEPNEKSLSYAVDFSKEFEKRFDEELSKINIEYSVKRASGRLKTPEVIILKSGTQDIYKRYLLSKGQREGQYKLVALQYQREVGFNFEPHAYNAQNTESEKQFQ